MLLLWGCWQILSSRKDGDRIDALHANGHRFYLKHLGQLSMSLYGDLPLGFAYIISLSPLSDEAFYNLTYTIHVVSGNTPLFQCTQICQDYKIGSYSRRTFSSNSHLSKIRLYELHLSIPPKIDKIIVNSHSLLQDNK